MSRKWRIALLLIMVAWWTMSPAAAAKIEHFKDTAGTLHITNVGPEDQPNAGSEATTTYPLRQRGVRPQLPLVQEPPTPPPVEVPAETEQTPGEAPQIETPSEPEVQPGNEQPQANVEQPVSYLGGTSGSPAAPPVG